ncbi:MAG: EamA family transporter [Aliifodinibius sp.]|nr:EamA family transporter [Fodinibius sp.]
MISAFFLGLTPIFGKQAIALGVSPYAVVALRTLFATLLLFVVMFVFQRKYLYIYPAGLIGCFMAGLINGIGSLFYYNALGKIDAGLGQMLYLLYPFFVAFWMFLDRQSISRITIIRLLIAIPAVVLLVQTGKNNSPDVWLGAAMMLGASALYALHLPINQRVLFDIPAPTVTLYTLLAMSFVVVPAYIFSGSLGEFPEISNAWWPIFALTLVTFFSRLTLFTGVKHLGGLQTALLGLSELLITLILSQIWLQESLVWSQWIGAFLLTISMVLVGFEKHQPTRKREGGILGWLSSPRGISPHDVWGSRDQ